MMNGKNESYFILLNSKFKFEEETMERQQGTLFTKRQLWQLIWPLIIEQLLAVTVGMADVMMVSSVGEAAVSAVSLVDMLNVLMLTFLRQ